jgi:hypothetical protein
VSWHYLPALAGESSAASCKAGAPSARSRSTRTVGKCYCAASETACSLCSRSGTTSAHSTGDPGVDSWMSSLAASPALHSLGRDGAREKVIPNGYGITQRESSRNAVQLSLSLKTARAYNVTDYDESSAICTDSGSMRNGSFYLRRTCRPRTRVSASGFLPTPCATETGYRKTKFKQGGTSPSTAIGGPVNPEFAEWMMGLPIGFTDLRPLATDRFRSWQQQHSDCFTQG